ncbi:MAG: RNA methyltransferase [Ardenticatenaceae bacterium]
MVYQCEADVAKGLEGMAANELRTRFGGLVRLHGKPSAQPGVLRFSYVGDLRHLLRLQMVLSVYLVQHYAVPRPRALLGDENFRALLAQINTVRALMPPDSYRLLYISAAGSDSSVMNRIKDEVAAHCGLGVASDEGDLLIRMRRSVHKKEAAREGWEVLVRLSPRPLATRAWRVSNMKGALNATVAHAMVRLTEPTQSDIFLNLACGSGTLLIERLACGTAGRMIGCDLSQKALGYTYANIQASGNRVFIQKEPGDEPQMPSFSHKKGNQKPVVELYPWDARSLPLPDQSVQVLCADLPFGHLVGSHSENLLLYPAMIKEAARVAQRGGLFVLITHEVRLMESLLEESTAWRIKQVQMVTLGGLHPRIFVLKRR